MRNLTVSLDERVARWARVAAAERDMSVSRFVSEVLRARMKDDDAYDAAMRRNLALKAQPLKRKGGRYPSREELHEYLVFVDTNVLVYRRDATERVKQPRAKAWVDALWTRRAGRLSSQVLQEYYQTVTRKLKPGLTRSEARDELRDLVTWRPVLASTELLERAFDLEDRFSLSFWDGLIVGAAQLASCKYLLTEDLEDGQDFDGVTVLDPFRHDVAGFEL